MIRCTLLYARRSDQSLNANADAKDANTPYPRQVQMYRRTRGTKPTRVYAVNRNR